MDRFVAKISVAKPFNSDAWYVELLDGREGMIGSKSFPSKELALADAAIESATYGVPVVIEHELEPIVSVPRPRFKIEGWTVIPHQDDWGSGLVVKEFSDSWLVLPSGTVAFSPNALVPNFVINAIAWKYLELHK